MDDLPTPNFLRLYKILKVRSKVINSGYMSPGFQPAPPYNWVGT